MSLSSHDPIWQEVVQAVDARCRQEKIPMLGPQKVTRLVELVKESKPNVVVEVGTAIGYSGLWIAMALRELGQGRLLTFEMDPARVAEARRNFERAGISDLVTQYQGDARELLREVRGPFDLLFLDGGFTNYYPCFLACRQQLRDGALLVADNALLLLDGSKPAPARDAFPVELAGSALNW